MTNSILNSPTQLSAAGAWGSLCATAVQEDVKSRHVSAVVPASAKKPAYGVKRNLEMCTEALGCETGGFDTAADDVDDGAERKRRAMEEEEEEEAKVEPAVVGRVPRAGRRDYGLPPPPLTTLLAAGVRMVHERRDGRLEVYAVRASGMEAERSGGRLRLHFRPCDGCNAAVRSQQEAEEDETEDQAYVVAKHVRCGRCVEVEGRATAARPGKKWEPEQAAAFMVAIT